MKRQEMLKMLPNRELLIKEFMKDPKFLIDAFKKEPGLVEWVFKEAKQERKYVKIAPELEKKLKEIAEKQKLAEGLLIGLGILLLISLLESE